MRTAFELKHLLTWEHKRNGQEHEATQIARRWKGYVVAVAMVGLAALTRWALVETVGGLSLYLTFYPVVVIAAVFWGAGPGIVATILSALAAALFFIPPQESGMAAHAVGMALFIAINIVMSSLGGRLRAKTEAFQETERRLQLAQQAAHLGAFEWNLQSGVNTWTPNLEALYGLKPGEFGRTEAEWETLVYPEDREKAVGVVNRALATLQPQEGDWRVIWPNGSVHWLFGRFQAFKDAAGKPSRLVGVNVDITDRKKTQEALRQSEEQFRAFVMASSDVVYRMSADWKEMRELQGREFIADTHSASAAWPERYIFPEDQPQVMAVINQAIQSKGIFALEHRIRRVDGSVGWTFSRAVPLLNVQGEIVEWFGAASDITKRKEAEQSVARQARLIDLAPAATLVRRPDGIITFWSRGAERLYGWPKEEALGHRTNDLLRTEFPEPLASITAKLQKGGTWTGELKHYTRDGRQVMVESYWLAELDAGGEVKEFLESNTDITDRKRLQEHLEDEVRKRTAKLRETMAELEHMSYSMIHDMRAPLRAMQGFSALLEEGCADCQRPPGLNYLDKIREASMRMDRLITDALNYNKIVREDLPISTVEAGRLLRGIIETYPNLQAPAADITLEFNELFVLGNESLLTQCFGNLLSNAVKFVAPGIHPCVRIWSEPAGTPSPCSTRIIVQDNGIGIAKGAEKKIFRMFQRMHREDEYAGTGIGLSIVKKAVERMQGRLGYESEPGKGSKFWVELPTPPGA